MIKFQEKETKNNKDYDTDNLRIEADYNIEVAYDVFWVPVNQLGLSRYKTAEIKNLLPFSPERKKDKIKTLFEAIQLYQISNFRGALDNIKYTSNNLCWNFHKPGFHAVRTNEGCCAANSNWLSYILYDKYEQIGFINYSQKDGGGHVINYIYHNGWYYFIDMMMYRQDSLPDSGIESGTINGYKDNELIAGNFFKSKMPISYVKFCLQKHKDPPVLFTISLEKELYAMACDGVSNCFNVIHPNNTKTIVLYKEKDFPLNFYFQEPIEQECNWDSIASEIFL